MTISKDVLDELLNDFENAEDLLGDCLTSGPWDRFEDLNKGAFLVHLID